MPELQRPRRIHSLAIQRLASASVIVMALMIALVSFGEFKGGLDAWWYVLLAVAGALASVAAYLKFKQRHYGLHAAKRTRDTVLKHVWEERHQREW